MLFIFSNKIVCLLLILLSLNRKIFANSKLYRNLTSEDRSYENLIVQTVMNIVHTCFYHTLDMVVFTGSFKNFTIWYQNFPPSMTMYTINLSKCDIFARHARHQGLYRLFDSVSLVQKLIRYPVKLYIVSLLTPEVLKPILKQLRKSRLWNSRAIFLLINEDLKSRCSNASYSLAQAWEYNILQALYVCYNDLQTINYYTFNPFTNFSTGSWNISDIIYGFNQGRNCSMSIFKFITPLNVSDRSTCQSLTFEKDQYLDGYPIFLSGQIIPMMFDYKNPLAVEGYGTLPLSNFEGFDANVSRIIWTHLRTMPLVRPSETGGYVDVETKQVHGQFEDIIKYTFDQGVNERYFRSFWRLETYPHDVDSMCVVTPRREQQFSSITKLMIYQPEVLFFIGLVSCVAALIFVPVLKIRFAEAFLEVLRALLGMSTLTEPSRPLSRLVYGYLIVLFFGVNLYFSGKLTSSFATNNGNDSNIDDSYGLIRSNYSIRGEASFSEFLQEEKLHARFISTSFEECLDVLLEGEEPVACFCDCYQGRYRALVDSRLYVSQPFYDTPVAYMVREDWPLRDRVNVIVQRMRESGILLFEDERVFGHLEDMYQAKKKEQKWINEDNEPFQGVSLRLEKMAFSLYFLAAGMIMALGIFAIEKALRRLCGRTVVEKRRIERLKIFL